VTDTNPAAGQAPDLIFHNGRIATLDRQHPFVKAASVRDGKILTTGDDKEVLAEKKGAPKSSTYAAAPLFLASMIRTCT